jgi:hypothetical protein
VTSGSVRAWADGHRWQRFGLNTDVLSLTVSPSGTVLALAADSGVWRRGKGMTWRQVMDGTSTGLEDATAIDEEELLMEAESVLDEQADYAQMNVRDTRGRDRADEEDSDEEVDPESTILAPTYVDDEASDLLADAADEDEWLESQDVPLVWAAPGTAGLVLCSRGDGLWRSEDDGISWIRLDGVQSARAFHQSTRHPEVIYGATKQGLRLSRDQGESWVGIHDPIANIPVHGFAEDDQHLWAGTDEGLFVSLDGLRWAKMVPRTDVDIPVWAIAVDPFWTKGLWLAGPVGILRSDDGGHELRPSGRIPLIGTDSLLTLSRAGHLLSGGSDGVWESQDGGVRWQRLARGLLDSKVNALALAPDGVLMAGPGGVFVLRRTSGMEVEIDLEALRLIHAQVADMGELVDAALRRPGLATTNVLSRRRLVASMLLPKLTLSSKWVRYRTISADHEAKSNKGAIQTGWSIGVTACFGNCSSLTAFSELDVEGVADNLGMEVSELAESTDVTVIGDEVYAGDEAGSLAPVAANVAQRLTRYRSEIANRVTELAVSRRRLVDARFEIAELSLRDQVAHELDIQEAAARLDVYTNGYFTRVLEGSTEESI